jgi:replicative DNA helicase
MLRELFTKRKPAKNYYTVLIVSVLVVVFTLVFRSIYLKYVESLNVSLFQDKSVNQINTEDFDFALTEVSEAILYVSYSGNKEITSIDRKVYKLLERKNLIDKVIYWDITDLYNSGSYLSTLRNKFPEVSDNISIAPLIIYIKDGKAVDVISSEFSLIDTDMVKDMIDEQGIE